MLSEDARRERTQAGDVPHSLVFAGSEGHKAINDSLNASLRHVLDESSQPVERRKDERGQLLGLSTKAGVEASLAETRANKL